MTKSPLPSPTVTPVQQVKPEADETQSHLEGTWESSGKDGKTKQLVFASDGTLQFVGGLGYFNPGRWELDPGRHELILTLPNADDEQLQIFQLYVGSGIKAFDRAQKQIRYAFDPQTWSLNVGGWLYTKADPANLPQKQEAEPVFK